MTDLEIIELALRRVAAAVVNDELSAALDRVAELIMESARIRTLSDQE